MPHISGDRWAPGATLRTRNQRQRTNGKVVCGLIVKSLSYLPRVSILSHKAKRTTEVFSQGKFRRISQHESEKRSEKICRLEG